MPDYMEYDRKLSVNGQLFLLGESMKKVELLAPAGNYEALLGAISAGADAVYLGGSSFGARAYADNFTQEEICEGIRYAHVFHKKVYLTVNTLVKEREFPQLYDFLLPFYEAGLDGVIIQDIGVLSFIRKHFPELRLHVSTQMTITGSYGAGFLKESGASRIVLARELSLAEIREIKQKASIEVETFVHGAMCYCYSGQCLFSSILGGRSGNRGRCAQPCRLPYRINAGQEGYPLSMKDMCTINILPELIEAGIDSLKIEGRMKKPEYAAGVTAIYRKYIDRYYQDQDGVYDVSKEDMEHLRKLYIRSSISEGYYHQHNGQNMITFSTPSYAGSDEKLLSHIRKEYIDSQRTLPVVMKAVFKEGLRACLTLTCGQKTVCLEGEGVQKAQRQPLSKEKIIDQLQKSGGTCFKISSVEVDMEHDIFMPISALNQLRREGLTLLWERIIEENGFSDNKRKAIPYQRPDKLKDTVKDKTLEHQPAIHVLVNTYQQLEAAILKGAERIYIDKISIDEDLIKRLTSYKAKKKVEYYLAFPYVVREKDHDILKKVWMLLNTPVLDGALVRNLETMAYLKKNGNTKPVVTDINLYAWNQYSIQIWKENANEVYLPAELNAHEWKDIQNTAVWKQDDISVMVYGRLPMMVSAGCLRRTSGKCTKQSGWNHLSDRYQKEFPVYHDCTYCYNIIYNSVPLSLHKLFDGRHLCPGSCRLDFTTENKEETEKIIEYFQKTSVCYEDPFYRNYTTGHYKRGVE